MISIGAGQAYRKSRAAEQPAELAPDAGEADGRISVRFPPGPEPRLVAKELMGMLREVLPAIELHAVWADGDTYIEVYRDQISRQRISPPLVSLPAQINDFPTLQSCEECRASPVVAVVSLPEKPNIRVCLDCQARSP